MAVEKAADVKAGGYCYLFQIYLEHDASYNYSWQLMSHMLVIAIGGDSPCVWFSLLAEICCVNRMNPKSYRNVKKVFCILTFIIITNST